MYTRILEGKKKLDDNKQGGIKTIIIWTEIRGKDHKRNPLALYIKVQNIYKKKGYGPASSRKSDQKSHTFRV